MLTEGGLELLEAVATDVGSSCMTVLPKTYSELVRVAKGGGELAATAAGFLEYMSTHPNHFDVQFKAAPFAGDSILSVCMLKYSSGSIAVICNDMALCSDILQSCGSVSGTPPEIFRVVNGVCVPLQRIIQSACDKLTYELRSRMALVDSSALLDGNIARTLHFFGLDAAMEREMLTIHLAEASFKKLAGSPVEREVQNLIDRHLVTLVPSPPDEDVFIRSLRFTSSGKCLVLTTGAACPRYSAAGMRTVPSTDVQFAELREDGTICPLSPEDSQDAVQTTAVCPAPAVLQRSANLPHQYLKPQMEQLVSAGEQIGKVYELLGQGANLCWPLLAAVKRNMWTWVEDFIRHARSQSVKLYTDAFVNLVKFLWRETKEDRALRICTTLQEILPFIENNDTLSPSVDQLKLLVQETSMEKLRERLKEVLKLMGAEIPEEAAPEEAAAPQPPRKLHEVLDLLSGKPRSREAPEQHPEGAGKAIKLDMLSSKKPATQTAGPEQSLAEARRLLPDDRAKAMDCAWQAANQSYLPAIEFLATEMKHPAAQCALGRMYLSGARLNERKELDPAGQQLLPKDQERGAALLKESADAGYPNGNLQVAMCYHHGRGVPQDAEKAMYYYRRARACHTKGIQSTAAKGVFELRLGDGANPAGMTLSELASRMGIRPCKLIAELLPMGVFAAPTTILDTSQIIALCQKHGLTLE